MLIPKHYKTIESCWQHFNVSELLRKDEDLSRLADEGEITMKELLEYEDTGYVKRSRNQFFLLLPAVSLFLYLELTDLSIR